MQLFRARADRQLADEVLEQGIQNASRSWALSNRADAPSHETVTHPGTAVAGGRRPSTTQPSLGMLEADGVTIVPARRMPDLLQALPPRHGLQRMAWLAEGAWLGFRAAA